MAGEEQLLALLSGGGSLLGRFFAGRSRSRQTQENNRATTAGLTLAQRRSEDSRRARLAYGQGLLGRVPANVDGSGGSLALDPTLFSQLNQERTYDFGSTLPSDRSNGLDAMLAGLFGNAADVLPRVRPAPDATGLNATTVPPDSGVDLGSGTGLNATTVAPDSGVDTEYLRSLTRTGGPR